MNPEVEQDNFPQLKGKPSETHISNMTEAGKRKVETGKL